MQTELSCASLTCTLLFWQGGLSEALLGCWVQQRGPFLPPAAQDSCSESPLNHLVVHGELQAPRNLSQGPKVWVQGCALSLKACTGLRVLHQHPFRALEIKLAPALH